MKVCVLLLAALSTLGSAQTLKTRWAASVTPQNAHREYPRPQMVRKDWVNLNGTWDVAIAPKGSQDAPLWRILVPFPIESQLGGVKRAVKPNEVAIYSRSFDRPRGERVLLHFGAVDWSCTVRVNGKEVGRHQGGYDPFTFDITDALSGRAKQDLEVEVSDPTDSNWQPRGKQVLKPGGIFYVPTTGIWQTVWLEGVPQRSIARIQTTARIDGTLNVSIGTRTAPGSAMARSFFTVELKDGNRTIRATAAAGGTATLRVRSPKLWSPESPTLYPLTVRWGRDEVSSYCAFREVGLVKNKAGQPVFALNGKPYFMVGPLDQGFWPDGLYTPPSEAAMKYDLEVTKRLGFNMIRKHVKVEPARWYYWCDKMGLLVFQDMPSGDKYIGPSDPDINRSAESGANYRNELKEMIDDLRFFPCIVAWVPYNEGWGQWKTEEIAVWTKKYDPTRLVDSASGWTDRKVGDMHDVHIYPGPGMPPNETRRALFLGEFGGLGLPMPGHMWQESGWGYQSFKTQKELTDKFVELFFDLRFLIARGLSGAVYTQTTDVETELNGLLTYDRARLKMDEGRVRKAVRDLFLPAPTMTQVVPTSESTGIDWRYTFETPSSGWERPGFDASSWRVGPGGFGTPQTPGAVVRTQWNTKDVYLRRTFQLPRDFRPGELMLRVSYDDDVEVYIDGTLSFKSPGWTTSYRLVPIPASISLTKGTHTLAIHCHQNQGGQYVDAGLVIVK